MDLEGARGMLAGLLPSVAAALDHALPTSAHGPDEPITIGVPDGAKAALIAALTRRYPGPVLVVTARADRARALAEDVLAWLPDEGHTVLLFPERESIPYDRRHPDAAAAHARLRVLDLIAAGEHPLIITDAQAIAQRTRPAGTALPALRTGARLPMTPFLAQLDAAGYRAAAIVDEPGTFVRHGGIVDLYPPAADAPVRIEWQGDVIDSLRRFDPVTQRSQALIDQADLAPAVEATVDAEAQTLARTLRAATSANEEDAALHRDLDLIVTAALPQDLAFWTPFLTRGTLWDHLRPGTLLIRDEPVDIRDHLCEEDDLAVRTRDTLEQRGDIPPGLPLPHAAAEEASQALNAWRPHLDLHRFAVSHMPTNDANDDGTSASNRATVRLPFAPVDAYGGRLRNLIDDLQRALVEKRAITVFSLQAPRLAGIFVEHGLPVERHEAHDGMLATDRINVIQGSLPEGWRLSTTNGSADLMLLTDAEIFGFAKQRRPAARARRRHETFLDDLQPNDFIVHVEHGIARYIGITRERIGDREHEYLDLRYASNDRLLVPTDQLHRLQRYIGPGGMPPALTRLGTQQWQHAKQRVRAAVRELAQQLLELYAARQVLPGVATPPDGPWMMEMEASFPYVETPDQLHAVHDVKTDMERARPMDRIVVGDVGYGKTEVAVRAAFKAISGGVQVAMLVPTTVLAQQHFDTFHRRLAAFPARVAMLSRFRSPAEQRAILVDLDAGRIDIIIGTHRLLQKDVQFKNLGLVIIDEEQRFGVAHKETLKRFRREVDVLTLSATPIPRTLHMALSGIRDMSTIETPPEERLPITTYVMETDDALIREAILRELERGGQVYFVHNRVQSIELITRQLRDLVPEARFLIGHGQMPEDTLEHVMQNFIDGTADVLVCTTIIESGLDISNVNTIIITQAERLGLAQLYQLRGRVGRSAAQAYAYLFYDRYRSLTETAQKRLQTIFDSTDLGAGFRIALRDLEIRGAGNLLGAEQSGPIGAVGFELYTQILAESVEQLRAKQDGRPPQQVRRGPRVSVDLPLVAHLPESYIADVNLRLSIYQRLAAAETVADADAAEAHLEDRFGPPPTPVHTLLRIVRLRARAALLGAEAIQREEDMIAVRLPEGLSFDAYQPLPPLPPGVQIGRRLLRLDLRSAEDRWLDVLEDVLQHLTHDLEPAPAATAPQPADARN